MFTTLGITGFSVDEIVADGPNRVIAIVSVEGVDANDEPWSQSVVELLWFEDGQVTDIRPYYEDVVELRRIAATRGVVHE